MSSSRMASVAVSLAYTGRLVVLGPLAESDQAILRKYAHVDNSPRAEAAPRSTAIIFQITDDLTDDQKAACFERVTAAENIVIHGRRKNDKDFFDRLALARGFRKHPSYFVHVSYNECDIDGYWCIFQRIFDPTVDEKSVTMNSGDATRTNGAQADARLMRYTYASGHIRPGDAVLDYPCGSGDGAHILRTLSECASVDGRDSSSEAIAYARENFRQDRLSFAEGEWRTDTADCSIDAFVALEALERGVPLENLIDGASRVLRPGGRLILGAPLRSKSAKNLLEHPTYSKSDILGPVERRFKIETLHVQKERDSSGKGQRSLVPTLPDAFDDGDWLLIVAYKPLDLRGVEKTIGTNDIPFVDTIYAYPNPTQNLLSFERDYHNPELMRTLFGMGVRILDRSERKRLAREVIDVVPSTSADYGAALCVLGYDALETGSAEEAYKYLDHAIEYSACQTTNPHAFRWHVSLRFLSGLLAQKYGDDEQAALAFGDVITSDWHSFSATLGTKAAEASLRLGLLRFRQGKTEAARHAWTSGLDVARRLLATEFKEVIGDVMCPLPDAFPEFVSALETARKCADCLRVTSEYNSRSAYAGWRTIVSDKTMDSLRLSSMAEELQLLRNDARKWRRIRDLVYSRKWIGRVIRFLVTLRHR